ncbi:Molybdopterin biosynthesis protein MoeA [Lachnospiraceae bacterium TWA4]|nr:Molybdopterin biosynthesis protein MoeA [Lachnospiraceae bacterium TWA4]
MKLLNVETLTNSRELFKNLLLKLPRNVEYRSLIEARKCILAEDIYSPIEVPTFCRSTVDGYAVRSKDTFGATDSIPGFLTVVEEVAMGECATTSLKPGECAYVPTGGMLPKDADAMVMIEYCERFDANQIAVNQSVPDGNHVVYPGDDTKKGELIFKAGQKLGFSEIGTLASLGFDVVPVLSPLKAIVYSTGNELCIPGIPLSIGKVYDSNEYAIATQAKEIGIDVTLGGLILDDDEVLRKTLSKALKDYDFVFTSGGSSQGKKDMTEQIFSELTGKEVLVHGLALKPGKPTILAWDDENKTILLGLPGHPVAASIVFMLLVEHAFQTNEVEAKVLASLPINFPSSPGRETCVTVKLEQTEEGYVASPVAGSSGLWRVLNDADGYFLIGQNTEGLKAGSLVEVHLLKGR